jgi:hypothetical protein
MSVALFHYPIGLHGVVVDSAQGQLYLKYLGYEECDGRRMWHIYDFKNVKIRDPKYILRWTLTIECMNV